MENVEMIVRGMVMLRDDKAKIEYLKQHLKICHCKLSVAMVKADSLCAVGIIINSLPENATQAHLQTLVNEIKKLVGQSQALPASDDTGKTANQQAAAA